MISDIKRTDLRALSCKWKTEYDEYGKPVEKHLSTDYSRYRILQRRLAEVGRELLDDFRLWQVTELGCTDSSARAALSLVWVALYTTGARPVERLLDTKFSFPQRQRLRSALRRFVTWMLIAPDTTAEDRVWAKQVVADLEAFLAPATRHKGKLPTVPLPEEDLLVLHEIIERRHKSEGFRRPWAKPVLKIKLRAAANATEIVHLERDSIVEALANYDANRPSATISLWYRGGSARVIPVSLIEEELRTLVHWPADWGTIADLVAPNTADPKRREVRARGMLNAELLQCCKQAGIASLNQSFGASLRARVIIDLFKATEGDYLVVRQMFGVTAGYLRRVLRVHAPELIQSSLLLLPLSSL